MCCVAESATANCHHNKKAVHYACIALSSKMFETTYLFTILCVLVKFSPATFTT